VSKRVAVHLLHQSEPVVRENVRNTYQKGDLYCLMLADGSVEKYPLIHLFRAVES
jgi:hypothetical protein